MDSQLYRAFEDQFRGSEKLISARLQQYEDFLSLLLPPISAEAILTLAAAGASGSN